MMSTRDKSEERKRKEKKKRQEERGDGRLTSSMYKHDAIVRVRPVPQEAVWSKHTLHSGSSLNARRANSLLLASLPASTMAHLKGRPNSSGCMRLSVSSVSLTETRLSEYLLKMTNLAKGSSRRTSVMSSRRARMRDEMGGRRS